ncbi:MAG: hypothetical protein KGJ72_09760 [Gammaproteobacteria bacterium]|nr:hypothetical protein [Gammaproteobacteria bacterium]
MVASTLFALSPPRFAHGRLLITPGVRALIQETRLNVLPYLHRHLQGDWGDLCDADRRANDAALCNGDRLLSSYAVSPTQKLWIITEYDRSVTTLLLPDEY